MLKANPVKAIRGGALPLWVVACALAFLLGACGSPAKATRRVEPGDIVFKTWVHLCAYREDVARIVAANMAGVTAADIAAGSVDSADLEARSARIKKGIAELTAKYLAAGNVWEVPPGATVTVEEYCDQAGRGVEPQVRNGHLYGPDGNPVFAWVSWDGKTGYMLLDRTQ